ncbi:hypothetical protein PIB30_020583 [Stylosanthes scabra]|uniref:MATH domain-containing protein n=1 Tax=Stylosanthes scabra TaxID=79078 RepID=A0ABU6Q8J6_9FABA|nr:hypothetical protein [Stylosanthes scabra]
MKEEEIKVLTSVKFSWTINNSKLTCREHFYSDTFFTGPYSWQIGICTNWSRSAYITSVNLYYVGDIVNFPVGRRSANFKLSLFNHLETNSTIIIQEVCVNDLGVVDHNHSSSLIDFKGLCKIEKEYVEVLEESCSKHSSLIEFHKEGKRSQKFIECSFSALGKLLLFLKTRKVKDLMNHDACKELQDLWDEAEIMFDNLSWLEPHVKSILTYFEKSAKMEVLLAELEEKLKTL